ncbi:MAG: J domain-containing protein [Firmicutes bacterium]|nr:J domain-containing protein [Bacillota bacterium]
MEYKDYYKILGVEKTATKDEIKKAYRDMAKKYHPDKTKGDKAAEEKFKEANEAFEVLGDEEKRKKYDQFGQYGNFQGGMNINPEDFASMFGGFSGFGGGGNTSGFSDFFSAMFGGMGGGSGRTTYQTGGFSGNPFGAGGDPFGGSFGGTHGAHGGHSCGSGGCGGGCGSHSAPEVSYDLETAMTISLKEAFEGKSAKISYNAGEGKKTISVKIPAGMESGKKIKLKDQGKKKPDGTYGNLMITINIDAGEGKELKGLDIHEKTEIYPWEAYLGAEKIVETLEGKIKVKIPQGIKSGQKIKLSNRGYRDIKGTRGNLYIETVMANPEELPEVIKEAYESVMGKPSSEMGKPSEDKGMTDN